MPTPSRLKTPGNGSLEFRRRSGRQRVDEHRLLRAMAEQPAPWPYCCRLGTCDRKGKKALKNVHGTANCRGQSGGGIPQQWHCTSEKVLNKIFLEHVDDLLSAGGARPLPAGLTRDAAAARLRDEVAPVLQIDTPRICRPCWAAAAASRLEPALERMRQELVFPDEENESPTETGAKRDVPEPEADGTRTPLRQQVPLSPPRRKRPRAAGDESQCAALQREIEQLNQKVADLERQ
jgi:hypothetical protein